MPLRGNVKPTQLPARLKLLLSGPSGVGKTTAAIKMPKPYLIDTENGSAHYGEQIEASGGAIYSSASIDDIIAEVRTLLTEEHPYKTLIIDPITIPFTVASDHNQQRFTNNFQAFGETNKVFRRLCSLISVLDMNVIVTAHQKAEYEVVKDDQGKAKPEQVGTTFDGYKRLDYHFDLWLELNRNRNTGERTAAVRKTRLPGFPDLETFAWSYEGLAERYGKDLIEADAKPVSLASADAVAKFHRLYRQLSDAEVKQLKIDKALAKVEDVADLTSAQIGKGIQLMERHFESPAAA